MRKEDKNFVIKLAILSLIVLFFGALLYDWLFRSDASTIGYQGYAFGVVVFLFALFQLIKELILFLKKNRKECPPKDFL
jgi:membrane associated rhomboid family serine protease